MNKELNRHDIRDSAWEKIKLHTIGEKGTRGGNAKDTRHFINGVFWILVGALCELIEHFVGQNLLARKNVVALFLRHTGFKFTRKQSVQLYVKDTHGFYAQ